MQNTKGLLDNLKQHNKIGIRVSSQANNYLPEDVLKKIFQPHRKAIYFFAFVENGSLTHKVDLNDLTITGGQMFFVLPNQMHTAAPAEDTEYFKLILDQECLSLLPKSFSFLLNPLNAQIISFDRETRQRVKMLFSILNDILHSDAGKKNAEIILAHLNSLMTEFNTAYFKNDSKQSIHPARFSKFIEFKIEVETHLTEQLTIDTIASKLSISTNNLYNIVKEFSGISPKEFITDRLMLEAKRKLYYSQTSIKELAYDLGFNDPDYFSRLFKKSTGQSVTDYLSYIQDLSGNQSE